jgi:hypothetical protein
MKVHDCLGRHPYAAVERLVMSGQVWNLFPIAWRTCSRRREFPCSKDCRLLSRHREPMVVPDLA